MYGVYIYKTNKDGENVKLIQAIAKDEEEKNLFVTYFKSLQKINNKDEFHMNVIKNRKCILSY